MPPLRNPLADVPAQLHRCPWHEDGVTQTQLDQVRHEGYPIFPLVLCRVWFIRYGCGCQLSLVEELTATRQRAMGIR